MQALDNFSADWVFVWLQPCEPERLWACWRGAMESASWAARRAAVDEFNAGSRWALLAYAAAVDCSLQHAKCNVPHEARVCEAGNSGPCAVLPCV